MAAKVEVTAEMKRTHFLTAIFGVFLLLILSAYLLISNFRLQRSLKNLSNEAKHNLESAGISQSQIRSDIKKSLEEKYRADIVSHRVMIKRLEREKQLDSKQEEGR